jgi:hypothetical protein
MATKTITTYERDPDGMWFEIRTWTDDNGDLMEGRIPFGLAHIIRYRASEDESEAIN